jgi:carbonic anhydrase
MLIILLSATVLAWDYRQKGSDWEGQCTNGTFQSPINIGLADAETIKSGSERHVQLNFTLFTIETKGYWTNSTYKIDGNLANMIASRPSDQWYQTASVLQLHFHSPSENHLDGVEYDLEVHVVMQDPSQKFTYIVYAVFFKQSDEIDSFIMDCIEAEDKNMNFTLNHLIKEQIVNDFYAFTGSLTTPPCSENVLWLVDGNVRNLTQSQIGFFSKNWANNTEFAGGNGNDRQIQFNNYRQIMHYDDYASVLGLAITAWVALVF